MERRSGTLFMNNDAALIACADSSFNGIYEANYLFQS
jgi:hypothetical protein